ncbi:guanine nucleotide exchange protein smcr8a [Latimeria chalumnae]|uniref:SMCR8-C9orf72 complex subunit n=1 Tax=Latimeria chalumnae TaxID=7897 RepID=H3AM56_LATCH|nr:PREDICTED: Smith-Magenis syndrome chromosomal region candidate gene 8 protein [Latimeria chalumnae]|eukprot:XP_005997512.1 PREDICTED: Smith-Magenis syndrome chromosomal region candidate gene 8 protein [Latimeria chalumnae]
MISSPDLVAFTKDDDYGETYEEFNTLPEEYSVPLYQFTNNANPWSKASKGKFTKDFILISEFSEQVGPQPLLTIPDDPNAYGTFDLNYFSLRIMSVDYQASFVGHPPGCAYPKLNFVEDSKVVLGDSKEGAFAYVHHLTLYDLEARGFVRPFCMAYICTDESKIMKQFQEVSAEFSKASECLKTGNRKAFAKEVEKKLKDLEYTRNVLHNETEIQKKANDKGFYTTQTIEKANELANVEKSIIEHQDLLKQIRSYPYIKLKDEDFLPYEPEHLLELSDLNLDQVSSSPCNEGVSENNDFARRSSYTPKFIKAKSAKCFDKRLKTLEELCDGYFFHQTLAQLTQLEKMFRGDVCYLLTTQIERALLKQQIITAFLFDDMSFAAEEKVIISQQCYDKVLPSHDGDPKNVQEHHSVVVSTSLESYKSCVESLHIKMDQQVTEKCLQETGVTDMTPCDHLDISEYRDADMKGSISSGESIEVLGTDKSTPSLTKSESQTSLQIQYSDVKRKAVNRRTNSEDSIEVLSTTESQIPEDFKAAYPSAIDEEGPYVDDAEGGLHFLTNVNKEDTVVATEGFYENERTLQVDSTCCMGQESLNFEPLVESAHECCDDGVVNVPPQPYRQIDQTLHVNFSLNDAGYSSADCGSEGLLSNELHQTHLSSNGDASRLTLDEHSDSTSHISSTSASSDSTPSPALLASLMSVRQKRRASPNALWFIRQYPFAQPAIYSLLSGRTVVVLGEDETIVKKLVNALAIFVPNYGNYAKTVKQWVTHPLHISELQNWKLVGLQRVLSPIGSSMLHSLNRYSRYVSILDADHKTLRCPPYRGMLVSRLADHRTQIKRGRTYYLHIQSMLTQLCSKAFLYTFCHHLHLLLNDKETEAAIVGRRESFLKLRLGLVNEDVRIVKYLSELIKVHYIEGPLRCENPVLRFDYIPSCLYKI